MQRIGSFSRTEDGIFEGKVATLTVQIDVKFIPNPDVEDADSKLPDLLAFSNGAEIGAGWAKQEGGKPVFYTIRLDDPSWAAPLNAALFQNKFRSTRFDLVWSRVPARYADDA
ncbi:uncharacterized protein (DUF736 family) [Inquilinus ginsengisoli]|uniref:Uncharacterized protein (DUF736 family) n=1 Tax=Inquilinus ginsengisoli TaxID=363840 RepID=A0ABU1JYX0_9PROT|nr:DUF736 domain-containing protein [Inquilinus ginsengisoli]MDR6293818.1 uncharacterized protein (DUF736 family) [Inquilinus ginsengisoli]